MAWIQVRVGEVVPHGTGLISMKLDVDLERFEPGQFVNLALELGGKRVRRSYSVASAPGEPLELLLSEVPGGELTPSLFRLSVGQPVWLDTRPLGFFTLSHVPDCETLWLVATGTGVSPFLSILRAGAQAARCQTVIVVHGVREAAHLVHADELRQRVEASSGRLRYVPLVSRETPPADGIGGRIPVALRSGELERRAGFELNDRSHIMLCGNPQMIADMQAELASRGLRKHRRREPGHITVESYW